MNSSFVEAGFRSVLQVLDSAAREKNINRVVDYSKLLGDMLFFYRRYWNMPQDWVYEEMLRLLDPADRILVSALDADSRCLQSAAASLAETAAIARNEPAFIITLAGFLRKNGDLERARGICSQIAKQQPDDQSVLSELFMCEVGEKFWSHDYYDLLADIHANFKPRAYMEIGVATGKSLALAKAETRTLGVDPASGERDRLIYHSPLNTPQLYRMTSDDFFASHDLRSEMGQPCFDVAFIDGLHHFDQVLRDFINVEQFAGPDSIVLIHDCLPVDPRVATRERSTAFWTGDVWKIIPCLRAVRPDLEIITLPLAPAGLALVRRLDPASRLLSRQYINIVEQFDAIELPESWSERCRLLAVEKDQSRFRLADYIPEGGWS
jgi:hypothetical protein